MPISAEILQRIASNNPSLATNSQIEDEGVQFLADALQRNKTSPRAEV